MKSYLRFMVRHSRALDLLTIVLLAFAVLPIAPASAAGDSWTADRPKGCFPCMQYTASLDYAGHSYTLTNWESIDSSGAPGSYETGSAARAVRYAEEDITRAYLFKYGVELPPEMQSPNLRKSEGFKFGYRIVP